MIIIVIDSLSTEAEIIDPLVIKLVIFVICLLKITIICSDTIEFIQKQK